MRDGSVGEEGKGTSPLAKCTASHRLGGNRRECWGGWGVLGCWEGAHFPHWPIAPLRAIMESRWKMCGTVCEMIWGDWARFPSVGQAGGGERL